jgi:hypothetical protein
MLELEKIKPDEGHDGIPISAASRLLGVGRFAIKKFIEAGHLKSVRRFHSMYVSEKSVDAVLATVGGIQHKKGKGKGKEIRFGQRIAGFSEFLGYVLSGELRPTKTDPKGIGLQRYFFDSSDLARCREEINAKRGAVSTAVVCKMMSATWFDIHRLVVGGFIRRFSKDKPSGGFSLESVKEFCKVYATATGLARLYNMTVQEMKRILSKRGCRPRIQAERPTCQAFWSIKQVRRTVAAEKV